MIENRDILKSLKRSFVIWIIFIIATFIFSGIPILEPLCKTIAYLSGFIAWVYFVVYVSIDFDA